MRHLLNLATILTLLVSLIQPAEASAQDDVQLLINPTPSGGGGPVRWARIAVDGDTIAISSDQSSFFPDYFQGGIVHVFRRTGGTWSLEDTVRPPVLVENDLFGYHIALQGDTLVARAFRNSIDDINDGLYVFERAGSEWSLSRQFNTIQLPAESRAESVAIADGLILVGTTELPGAPKESGSVAVVEKVSGEWTETGRLPAPALETGDGFGSALDADGQWCVVGGFDAGVNDAGAIFIYRFGGGQWQLHQQIDAPDSMVNLQFGCAVGIRDDVIAVNDLGVHPVDATYVYRLNTDSMLWEFESELISEAGTDADFRLAVGENIICAGTQDGTRVPQFTFYYFDGAVWQDGFSLNCGFGNDCDLLVPPRPESTFAIADDYIVARTSPVHQFSRDYAAIVGPANTTPEFDCNGNLLHDAFEIAIGHPDCNSNGIPDECEPGADFDCDNNFQCDAFDIAYWKEQGFDVDCNDNGILDSCESFDIDDDGDGAPDVCDNCPDLYNPEQLDCDQDGIGDLCAIADGLVEDCNADGIPDFCQDDYVHDNGVANLIWVGNNSDFDCVVLQHFTVQPGGEIINGISVFWSVLNPRPATLLLYRDPNNDGDPNDGELLWQQDLISATQNDGYVAYPVDDVFVGNDGQTFFVAVMSTGNFFPAPEGAFNGVAPGRWVAADNIGEFDPTDLASLAIAPPFHQDGGPWMIRASASPRVACQCPADFASSRGDSGEGDGEVNMHDLLALLDQWGGCADPCPPKCPADVTGDCAVDVFDLIALLQQWGPCE